jgi:hypothetical protein
LSPAVFDGLKARLDKLVRDYGSSDSRAYLAGLREALLEAKLGVGAMRDALAKAEHELAGERKALADAERRGRLAADLPDRETVELAERFARRHRERITILERKIVVQRDELAMAEREVEEMGAQFRRAGRPEVADSISAAWRDLESAGGSRPGQDDRLQRDSDERLREAAIEAQLAYLKKKMGKDKS